METDNITWLGDMERVYLGKDDALVLRVDACISKREIDEFMERAAEIWPDNKVLILTKYVEIGVIDGEAAEVKP